jgi:2-polyprenyl-6-methoxyphenol hydroxylase-like FAD-dependent oxidoreductase
MSSASAAIETPVLIVGGGSVGLALASELGGRGVPCLVLEQNDKPADHPRATALNARSMEFMRRWGVADAVREAAAPEDFPHTALYCTALDGYEIARLERPNHGGRKAQATSPEQAQRCNQIWLDPILCAHVQSLPSIDLRFCWRFEELREDGDHVVATVRDLTQDRQHHVIAQYVIDCSGGHSPIRRACGITMSGSPHIGYHLSIYVRAPALWTHHDKGKAALINFVEPTGLWRNMVTLDGRELYRFGVRGKEYYDDPDRVDAERLFTEVVGKNVPHEILSVRRWTARNVVADTYRVGSRIFLAGDAAHLNHPASGLGLNTGLGDATNIGWKLHAVLAGWGGPMLLDSYESERRPVGIRNISHAESSNSNDRNQKPPLEIADDTPAGEKARREMGDRISKGMTRKFVTDGLALGYRYAPSSICWDDGTPPPPDSVSDYAQTSYPGSRAPHAWLSDGRSTIDAFGPGFTLLRFGDKAPATTAIERGFSQRDVPLVVLNVTNSDVGALYERALVLVRPDGHVAWRSDTLPPDALALVDRVRGAGKEHTTTTPHRGATHDEAAGVDR